MSVADRLSTAATLAEDGQVLTLTYPANGTYVPGTGSTSGSAPDDESVAGVIVPLGPFRKAQGNVIAGDQQLLLAAQNIGGEAIAAPVVNGTIIDANNKTWTITAVEPLAPAGISIMFDCVVRRTA